MNFKMTMVEALACAAWLSAGSAFESNQSMASHQGSYNESIWLPEDVEVDLEGMHDQLEALAMSVPVAADTDGARRVLGDRALRRLCHRACDDVFANLEEWELNPHGPDSVRRAYIRTGTPRWLGTTRKTLGSRQVDQQELKNDLSIPATSEVRLTSSVSNSVDISTSNTVETGTEVSLEVEIPKMFKVTAKTSFTVSASHARTQRSTQTSGSWNTVSVRVPPYSTACVTMEADHEVFEGDFEVDVCYDGHVRCNFGEGQCDGHFFWWISLRHLGRSGRCKKIRGRMTANSYVHARAHTYKGHCRRKLTDDIITSGAGLEVVANATGIEPNDRRLEAVVGIPAFHI